MSIAPKRLVRTAPAARRTQQERREGTRLLLLETTIQSLIDVGYAGTTSRRVAELARVSRGAQTHHFPHRQDLIAAAVEHLVNSRISAIVEKFQKTEPGPDWYSQLLDVIWADFNSPMFEAAVKVWVTAADDKELYERLVPVERRLRRAMLEAAANLAVQTGIEEFDRPLLELCVSTLRGLAFGQSFEPRSEGARVDRWPSHRAVLLQLINERMQSPAH